MTTPRDAIGLSERLRERAALIGPPFMTGIRPLLDEAATQLDALQAENTSLRSKLFPYADSHEISGMSWSGFYLIGDKKSISELRRLENRSAQLEQYSTAYEERIAAAESRATRAEQQRDEALERLKPFAYAAESLDESHLDRMDLWESPSGLEITADHLRAARDCVRRLAAGTEKEGK